MPNSLSLSSTAAGPIRRESVTSRSAWAWLAPTLVGALALAARLASVQWAGGLHALLGYDEGVYMGAATAFVHGLMPYRDFTLVHPPGSMLLLTPFAALGRATSEPTGWAAARIAVMSIGAMNAALITVIGRRVSWWTGVAAGLLYALWGPAIHVERTTMLEGFVLAGLVIALVALRRPHETLVRAVLAGAALGMGTSVKLWGAVPIVVIVCWLLAHRAWRTAGLVLGSSLAAFLLVAGPFLAIVRGRMIELVLLAQIGRGDGGTDVADRPKRMLSMDGLVLGGRAQILVFTVVTIVVLATALVIWRRPVAHLWAALLIVQAAVLLAVPVYFAGYSSFIGPALVLVLGAALDVALKDPSPGGLRLAGSAVGIGVFAALAILGVTRSMVDGDSVRGTSPKVTALADAARCVSSDSPGVALLYDSLGRSIDAGCSQLVDVDGTVYAVDTANPDHAGSSERRLRSLRYQEALQRFFAEGDVVMIHRRSADLLSADTKHLLRSKGLIATAPGLRVYGSRPTTTARAT